MRRGDLIAFLVLCGIWGSTWLGIKAGLAAVPPLLLAGTRFTAAGAMLTLWAARRGDERVARADVPRLILASVSLIAACYGLLFWGMQFIDSGTAAVLEMGLTPVALLVFALAYGEEVLSIARACAIALGVGGLMVLFGPEAVAAWRSHDAFAGWRVAGAGAVALAALVYGYGSVLSRPLLRRYSPTLVAGATTLIGGVMLVATSLAVEPGAVAALKGDWGLRAWAGWAFLVLFGSLVGYTLYIRLLRDIGASRAGTYAFVSPVIAVGLGALVEGEAITSLKVAGVATLLTAAWLAMREPKRRAGPGRGSASEAAEA